MEKLNLQTVDMVNLKINNIPCRAPAGSTIQIGRASCRERV